MISLNLTTADHAALVAQLKADHTMRITIYIRDRQEEVIDALVAPMVISGSIQMDTTADITRSLELVCLDPAHKMSFDSQSPANGAVYADNFISIDYGVWVDTLSKWVDIPVFWGPVTNFERDGAVVTVEAQGKESLAHDPHLVISGYTIRKGVQVIDAIKNVMNRMGETRYRLGMLAGKLNRHRPVHPQAAPWDVLVGGAPDSTGGLVPGIMSKAKGHKYLYFDGRGTLTAKNKNANVSFTFDNNTVLTQPGFTFDISSVINYVVVTGSHPKHKKKLYRGTATLPSSHPMSPQSLARHGHPRNMVEFFTSDTLKSDAACKNKAEAILSSKSDQAVSATFDALPVPMLEEYDVIRLSIDGFSIAWPLRQYTLPLTSDTPMSIGYLRQVKPRKHKKRKPKK